jgi:broad specificity phosphatase PhoE
MTQIILVRHGRTPWNKDKIFRGSKDIPLDDLGREEAWAAAEWLKDETIHAAYTSPARPPRSQLWGLGRSALERGQGQIC